MAPTDIDPAVISEILRSYIQSETEMIRVGAYSECQLIQRQIMIANAQLLLCWISAAGGKIPFKLLDPEI